VRVHDLTTVPDPVDSTNVDIPAVRRPRRAWGGEVRRITAAADGRIWFTDFGRSRVVRYDPVAGELDMFASVEARSEPYGLALTSRGHLWYSERGAGHVTVLDPVRNQRLRVRVPSAPSHARHIVVDEKRGRVWFPLSDVSRIGMVEYR
jgi:virginiamycin B lyase